MKLGYGLGIQAVKVLVDGIVSCTTKNNGIYTSYPVHLHAGTMIFLSFAVTFLSSL